MFKLQNRKELEVVQYGKRAASHIFMGTMLHKRKKIQEYGDLLTFNQ